MVSFIKILQGGKMLLGKDYKEKIHIVIDNTATINNITLINKKYKNLSYNFNTMRNLYSYLNKSPLQFNIEFFNESNDYLNNLTTMIFCMCNAQIEFNDLRKILEVADKELYNNLKNMIFNEMYAENEILLENEDSTADDIDPNKLFEDYYNYYYYIAKAQLHMTEEEFLESSPREIKTMANFDKAYKQNIIISCYGTGTSKPVTNSTKELDVDTVGFDTIFNMI